MVEEQKGFLQSKAFILILVWIILGGALSLVMFAAMPRMQLACESWAQETGLARVEECAAHGHGEGPEAKVDFCHLVYFAPQELEHLEHELEHEKAHLSPAQVETIQCQIEALAAAVPNISRFRQNLAAAFHGMYGTDGKMRLATAWSIPNFLILVTILWHFASGPLNQMFRSRREELKKAMEEAQQARAEAEARLAEYERKLAEVEVEIARVRGEVRAEAEAEKNRIVAEANRQAQRIKNEAEFTARQELLMARHRLREEAARLAVEVAEKVIKETIDDSDRDRLLDEYLGKIMERQA
jgi:F-type H+-transporting ATPase subunit b